MKRFERLLVPTIIVGVGLLVLSGCEKPGSALWPPSNSQVNSQLRHQPSSQTEASATSAPTSASTPSPSLKQGEKIPADKAVVYIYRPTGAMFGADMKIPFDVKANGKVVTTLVMGGYTAYVTEPGQIEFTAFDTGFMAPTSVFSVTVDAKAGQAYYLKGAHGKGLGGRAHLEIVSPETGAQEVTNCKQTT